MRLIEDEAKVEVESFFKGIIFSVLIFLLPKYQQCKIQIGQYSISYMCYNKCNTAGYLTDSKYYYQKLPPKCHYMIWKADL